MALPSRHAAKQRESKHCITQSGYSGFNAGEGFTVVTFCQGRSFRYDVYIRKGVLTTVVESSLCSPKIDSIGRIQLYAAALPLCIPFSPFDITDTFDLFTHHVAQILTKTFDGLDSSDRIAFNKVKVVVHAGFMRQ